MDIFLLQNETILNRLLAIIFLLTLPSVTALAENNAASRPAPKTAPVTMSAQPRGASNAPAVAPTAESQNAPTGPIMYQPGAITQQAGTPTLIQLLLQKLTLRDGKRAEIVVFSPMDDTKHKVGKSVANNVVSYFKSYGPMNIRGEPDVLQDLTLEEFRVLMARHKADVLIGLVTRDTHFNMYLYDRRSPYAVYAHSEQIPENMRTNLTEATAQTYTRLLVRRLLFRYLNNQYFELPREESLPVLQAEIPKWVASEESLSTVNREYISRFYGSLIMGAQISMARSNQLWNANLVGAQLGVRLVDKLFLEGTATTAAYNTFTGALRYLFINRNFPFQITAGLGFSFMTKDKVWTLDQTVGLGRYSYYITPSASVMWPIGDVYLKLESQISFNLSFNQFVFTFTPGIFIYF